MKIDIHCHTSKYSGCSRQTPEGMAETLLRRGINGVIITEHSILWKKEELEELQKKYPELLVLNGVEITAGSYDILVYGVKNDSRVPEKFLSKEPEKKSPLFGGSSMPGFSKKLTVETVLDYFTPMNCAFVLPHPFRHSREMTIQEKTLKRFHAIEVDSSRFNQEDTELSLSLAKKLNIPTTIASDSHSVNSAGLWYIQTPELKSIEEFVNILKNGKWTREMTGVEKEKENEKTVRELIEKLKKGDRKERIKTMQEIESFKAGYIIKPLIEILHLSDPPLKCLILQVLGNLREKQSVSHIIKLMDDAKSSVREFAVEALGKINIPLSVNSLMEKGLKYRSPDVRLKAAKSLVSLGDPKAIESIIKVKEREGIFSIKIKKELEKAIKELAKKTSHDKIKEELLREGIQKGNFEGKKEIICKFLQSRFEIKSIKLQEKIKEIKEPAMLDKITDKIFKIEDIEKVQMLIDEILE